MIYLLDCDMNGTDSVRRYIDAGYVVHIPCPTFKAYEAAVKWLLPRIGPADLVILDTLTSLANTTRGDAKLTSDPTADLWDVAKEKYLGGDKNYLTVYEFAGQIIMRRVKNILATNCRVLITAHEEEQKNELTGLPVRAPAMNEALYRSVMGASSDVFRLFEQVDPIVDAQGNVLVKSETRVLQLKKTTTAVAKFHIDDPEVALTLPKAIPLDPRIPALPYLYGVLRKKPSCLVVYGSPGVGKTTTACSEAQETLMIAQGKPIPTPEDLRAADAAVAQAKTQTQPTTA